MDYGKYLLGCILGMLPPSVTFPIMGMSITDVHSPMFITAFCAELFFMASSFFLYRIYRRKKRQIHRDDRQEDYDENRNH